ncbi:hypothetical protein [Amycolatopsis sp. cmx-11-51]|uniref:hypothetical protein n=1 Tax=Amycolatopsis sp. cmx-11-51 TaxID=2785797 RepID=UPI0039E2980F
MITLEEFVAALPYRIKTERELSDPIEVASDSSLVYVPNDWWKTESTNPNAEDEFEDIRKEDEQQNEKKS